MIGHIHRCFSASGDVISKTFHIRIPPSSPCFHFTSQFLDSTWSSWPHTFEKHNTQKKYTFPKLPFGVDHLQMARYANCKAGVLLALFAFSLLNPAFLVPRTQLQTWPFWDGEWVHVTRTQRLWTWPVTRWIKTGHGLNHLVCDVMLICACDFQAFEYVWGNQKGYPPYLSAKNFVESWGIFPRRMSWIQGSWCHLPRNDSIWYWWWSNSLPSCGAY